MSDFILNPADEFIPDPIWLIDMLRNDLKQLDQMDGARKKMCSCMNGRWP